MSEINTRPRISRIEPAGFTICTALPTGAASLRGQTLAALVGTEVPTLAPYVATTVDTATPVMVSLPRAHKAQLDAEHRVLSSADGVSPIVLKTSILTGLNAAGYFVTAADVQAPLRALHEADTVVQIEQARTALVSAAQAAHLRVLTETAASVCRDATVAAGFYNTTVKPTSDGGFKVVGLDEESRALVSDVRINGTSVGLRTEVIGAHEPVCGTLMDAFDRELSARGVRAKQTRVKVPSRRRTRTATTAARPQMTRQGV